MLSSKDFWQTRNVERLGIHNMVLSDGPHGVRRQAGSMGQLGPGLNIKRIPLCGRNFEYFSEDLYPKVCVNLSSGVE